MRSFALVAVLAFGVLAPSTVRAEEVHLVLLHTTDLHGALTAWDYPSDKPAARGLVKLATMVKQVRDEGAPTLLLDNGDCTQGGPIDHAYHADPAMAQRPDPMIAAMNLMGYDAMSVGNHEFSYGPEAMARARGEAHFPWLACNVVRADGKPAFDASVVKQAGPLKVGIVGVVTPAVPSLEDSSHWAGLTFTDPVVAARAEVDRLRREEACDVVVLLAHTGLEPEGTPVTPDENWGRRLARGVPQVDVIILGHTHRIIQGEEVDGSLLTQAGSHGDALGRIDFKVERATPESPWRIAERHTKVIEVTDDVADDAAMAELAAPYHAAAEAELNQVIGEAADDLAAPDGRLADSAPWDLVHDAQLRASGADVSLAALYDPRVKIPRGPVTMRSLLRLYPYDNTLATVELTGAELKQVLEHSARHFASYTFADGAPLETSEVPGWNFDMAKGVSYTVDLMRPAGDRITGLSFQGNPLAPDKRLKVAVNNYRLNGGGGFPAISSAPRLWHSDKDIRTLIADYVRHAGPLHDAVTADWHLSPAYAATPERALVDRLVRFGTLDTAAAVALDPDAAASRAEVGAWIARAFGWRAARASGTFGPADDALEPWLDGLVGQRVLARPARRDAKHILDPARLGETLDWCEAAARKSAYALAPRTDPVFRADLLSDTGLSPDEGRDAPVTRGEALAIVANLRLPELRILETTDFHGAMLETTTDRATGRVMGGSANFAAHVEALRAANPAGTVLLDGGDCFQGTMISNFAFGRPVVEQMNYLRYAAVAIGNHEFDWSVDTLRNRIAEMHFAALGANLRERTTGKMPSWVRADTTVVRRGVRVGVLGLCYRYTPTVTLAKHVANLTFLDDSAAAAHMVPKLRETSDVVVCVGHIPNGSDREGHARDGDLMRLARGVPGVAAWFGGHSHNRLVDRVNGVPVMIAGAYGRYVGVCDMVVDPVGNKVFESHIDVLPTWTDEMPPDPKVQAIVDKWNASVAPIAATPVGRTARPLTRSGDESEVGDLVTDAMRVASHADVALQNTGGLRADLPEGEITRGMVFKLMPFDNLIVTMDLTPEELKLAIDQALVRGRVTQVSGIRYTFDRDRPEGHRVLSLTGPDGAPLDPKRTLRVACNDFMATGGDNYNALQTDRNRVFTDTLVRDALEQYIVDRCRNGATLDVKTDDRIRRVGGSSAGR